MVSFETSPLGPAEIAADAVVVGAGTAAAAAVDEALGGGLQAHLAAIGFKAKLGDTSVVPSFGRIPSPTAVVVGLGQQGPSGPDDLRRAAGAAARKAGAFPTVAVTLATEGLDGDAQAVQATVEGFALGAYSFDRYKTGSEPRANHRAIILGDGAATQEGVRRGSVVAEAVTWARDLISEPAGGRGPETFAALAAERAREAGLEAVVLDVAALERLGMNGILGVGQGSTRPPRLLILRYRPEGATGHLGVVGKGITFDSGGLSLKPAESMETMKTDCSGAAAVAAALCALPALGPRINVTAAMPLADNMPSGSAIKPGDVIRHYGGRTSEVLNTDAEGRLVLADTLAWMAEQHPDAIIDFATLTGAMVVALGKKVAGFFATGEATAASVRAAATASGERVWQMPLLEDLRSQGDSDVADIKNIGNRWGGAIFAALFLRDFVGEVPWAHVDIAGPARSDEAEFHIPKGPTGMGTRLLIEWICQAATAREGAQDGA